MTALAPARAVTLWRGLRLRSRYALPIKRAACLRGRVGRQPPIRAVISLTACGSGTPQSDPTPRWGVLELLLRAYMGFPKRFEIFREFRDNSFPWN